MFFNSFRLGQAENEKVQMDSPKKKAVGEKIVIDAEDLLSIVFVRSSLPRRLIGRDAKMTGLKVLLDQPRDSFSAGTFVNMFPFGNDTVLPFIQVDCRGWDIFENRARNLREAAACESLQASQGYHNSWLTLHEDKKNKYDPNAIELLVRGKRLAMPATLRRNKLKLYVSLQNFVVAR